MTGNVIKMFGDAAAEHQRLYGTTEQQIATVAFKNHRHSVHNPNAVNQKTYTMEQILKVPLQSFIKLTQGRLLSCMARSLYWR